MAIIAQCEFKFVNRVSLSYIIGYSIDSKNMYSGILSLSGKGRILFYLRLF